DGNLTGDGIWNYQWDAENRLVRAETNPLAVSFGIPHRIIECAYDYRHRRVEKKVINGATSATLSHHRYIYDGQNLIAELDQQNSGSLSRSFTWGLDLTGSLTATGSVGGLLEIRDNVQNKTLLPTYDGNGN